MLSKRILIQDSLRQFYVKHMPFKVQSYYN